LELKKISDKFEIIGTNVGTRQNMTVTIIQPNKPINLKNLIEIIDLFTSGILN